MRTNNCILKRDGIPISRAVKLEYRLFEERRVASECDITLELYYSYVRSKTVFLLYSKTVSNLVGKLVFLLQYVVTDHPFSGQVQSVN